MNPDYIRNRTCSCVRCRAHGLMGAVILITVGILFLLDNNHVVRFDRTFPIIPLVIGCVLLVARTGSMEGHVNPGAGTTAVLPQNPAPPQWPGAQVAPPPPPEQNDPQVKP